MKLQKELYEMQAEFCKMMANAHRIAIMELLSQGETSVGDLATTLEMPISAVSQHLRVMKDKGIVVNRKDARTVYYSLKHPELMEGCHIMRKILLAELESRGQIAQKISNRKNTGG